MWETCNDEVWAQKEEMILHSSDFHMVADRTEMNDSQPFCTWLLRLHLPSKKQFSCKKVPVISIDNFGKLKTALQNSFLVRLPR